MFGLLYLAVVLRRLLQEPSALFYFCIILVKVLPHAPLVLGFRRQFLRCVVCAAVVCGPDGLGDALCRSLLLLAVHLFHARVMRQLL